MKKVIFFIASFFASVGSAAEVEVSSWMCQAEETTGFSYGKKGWEVTTFKTKNDRFLIRPIKESDGYYFKDKKNPYGVFEFGTKRALYRCKDIGNIICNVGSGDLRFSRESLRFIRTYTHGYWEGADSNEDTPTISRGTCVPL